jgi:hypothetical protein
MQKSDPRMIPCDFPLIYIFGIVSQKSSGRRDVHETTTGTPALASYVSESRVRRTCQAGNVAVGDERFLHQQAAPQDRKRFNTLGHSTTFLIFQI